MTFEAIMSQLAKYESTTITDGTKIFWKTFYGHRFVAGIATDELVTVMAADDFNEHFPDFKNCCMLCMNNQNEGIVRETMVMQNIVIPTPNEESEETSTGIQNDKNFFPPHLYFLGNQMYIDAMFGKKQLKASPFIGGKIASVTLTGKSFYGFPLTTDAHYFMPIFVRERK